MKYLVIEIQTAADGTVAPLLTVHDTQAEAEQKYHQVLSFASVSDLDYHSAAMLTDQGDWVKSETYNHEAAV